MILQFTRSPSEREWVDAVKKSIDAKELDVKSLGVERVDAPRILLSEHDKGEQPDKIHMRKGHRVTHVDGGVATREEIHAIASKYLVKDPQLGWVETNWRKLG